MILKCFYVKVSWQYVILCIGVSLSLSKLPLCWRVSGLILHEEHIELLTEDFKALKREVEGKILQEGTLHFTGKKTDVTWVECTQVYAHVSQRQLKMSEMCWYSLM